jgi:hypothetical protein
MQVLKRSHASFSTRTHLRVCPYLPLPMTSALRHRQYAETVADQRIAALFDIDRYGGTGRLYLP